MKKRLPILLIILFTSSLFSSCSQPGFIFNEGDEELCFHGSNVTIATGNYLWSFPPVRGTSASEDRILDRFAQAEQKFDFKIDYILDINPAVRFLSAALTGSMQVDFLYSSKWQLYECYLINTLRPTENVISDPESDKWFSPMNKGIGLYGGKMYCIFPNYWETAPLLSGMMNVNMDALGEYGINSPYEYIETGEWNWENFRSFLEKIKFRDGDREWRGLGMLFGGEYGGILEVFPFVLSNGGSFIKEINGRYLLNVDSPEAMETYDFIANLGAAGLLDEIPVDDPAYISGEKWILTCGYYRTSDVFNIAQIRYPYGPRGNKDTFSVFLSEEIVWSFPIFSAYAEEEIGAVAEYFFEPLSPSVYPNGWKNVIDDNVFYYPGELEYYINGVRHAEFIDTDVYHDSAVLFNSALIGIKQGVLSPSAAIDSVIEIMAEEINEKYNK